MRRIALAKQILGLTLIVAAALRTGSSQQSASTTNLGPRDLWDSNLLNKRPPGKRPTVRGSGDDAIIGVTLWKLRPSNSTDDPRVRSLVHEDDQTRQWTPERISAQTPLHESEKVRISIEAARTGYLYVVDSDEYQDGSKGDPHLIFPTTRIRGGDNLIGTGTLVEIPSQQDTPPFFKMRRSRPDQTAEVLTVLVSPKPIEGMRIGGDPLLLKADQLAQWRKQWFHSPTMRETSGKVGTPYTLDEKVAGNGEKKLSQDDPLPQTIYHLDVKAGEPLLVEVQLRIAP